MNFIYFTGGLIALIGLGGIAVGEWIDWCKITEESCKLGVAEWAYWVSAIGTVATMLLTIWIATSESRRRLRGEHALAKLTCWSVLYRHADALKQGEYVFRTLELGGGELPVGICTTLADQLHAINKWQAQELIPIANLPNNAAESLTIATEAMLDVERQLRTIGELSYTSPHDVIRRCAEQLKHAFEHMDKAFIICERFVKR